MSSGADKIDLFVKIFEMILKYKDIIDALVSLAERIGKIFGWDGSMKQAVVVNTVAKISGIKEPEEKQVLAAVVDTVVVDKNASGEFTHVTPTA